MSLQTQAVALRRQTSMKPIKKTVLWPYIAIAVLAVAIVLLVPLIPGFPDPGRQDPMGRLQPPVFMSGGSWEHPLGTDQLGRDIFSRILAGARLTVMIATIGVLVSGILGTTLGVVSGYMRGKVDFVISRLIDAQLSIPFMLFAIALIVARGQSLAILILVLVTFGWAEYARIVRSEVLSLRERPWVTALRLGGIPSFQIVARHIAPNVMNTVLVIATLQVGGMVLGEGGLSFLGLGVVSPNISWGLMLAEGRAHFTTSWWVVVFPGLAIAMFVLFVNLFGDALRRRLDPRRKVYS